MKTVLAALILSTLLAGVAWAGTDDMVLLSVPKDPTVSFRILFKVGAQDDPAGKEGLAALTASLVTEGATKQHSYEQILGLLYPMASSISEQVDKEMTVFYGRTHKDNLDAYYSLLREVLLQPAFDQKDFDRVKSDMLNYVKTTLRYSQDEELGKEVLYEFIFAGTTYGHNEEGWVKSLDSITLDDVKSFYAQHYTHANLVIGLGGGFDQAFAGRVQKDFEALPAGQPDAVAAPKPAPIHGMHVEIVQKNAPATAISFGFPIDVVRGDKDFYPLAFATAWLGEHRNSFSHLYQVIRERRGLNYGDYAYVEHFPGGGFRQFPPTNVARRQQIFQIWIRPVPAQDGVFAFRAALRELQNLVDKGMTQDEFDLTRKFLKGYILHYAPTTMSKLGYALDDRFYGIKEGHWNLYQKALDNLTLDQVNAALKKHLDYHDLKVVFVAKDAEGLKKALVSDAPSPITYTAPKPDEIIQEDKIISTYPLHLKAEDVIILPIGQVFEG